MYDVTQALSAELDRRHQRLDLRSDGYHLQHRRQRQGDRPGKRWTPQGTWDDIDKVPRCSGECVTLPSTSTCRSTTTTRRTADEPL